ncbi:MAG: PHP domain-containing protein [Bacteroidetes bacterium]|uniref:helix-hairpin-helix domain-containing protein n=1 Tax=Phnomibacter sp. TaxID=2836217 RepID=UPI002FDD1DA9|nr:PHP domain-containing protein [Bacteroidota bacterium]
MDNYQIADAFALLAKIMDIHGENSFKTKTYANAAFQIEKLPLQLADMDAASIAAQKGIGAATAQKIAELLQTGSLSILNEYIANTPPGVIEMLSIKGLGPKKIHTVWKEMGIETIGELEYACNENRLTLYKGFGEKTQNNVADAIRFYLNQQGWFLFQQAEEIAQQFLQLLQIQLPTHKTVITGSIRRQMETVDSIDLLTTADATAVMPLLQPLDALTLTEELPNGLCYQINNGPQLFIHTTSSETWGHALLTTTGPDAFCNSIIASLTTTAFASEEDLFTAAQQPYILPAFRDLPQDVIDAAGNISAELIQPQDIKGIIHSHSVWSDGSNSIREMAESAKAQGLEYLVISDHSKSAGYANGLSEERILQQHAEIDLLNKQLAPFKIFKSIECDILNDGSLDYSDAVLNSFDLVIASVHSNLKMTEEKAMQRLLTAIAHPAVTVLGHMTGRLLLSRAGYPVNYDALIEACAKHHVCIELNAHPRRLDIDWRWIPKAVNKGILISINPDAHAVEGFADTRYGVLAAQKGMLRKQQNLSSFSLQAFEEFLEQNKAAKTLAG